MTAQKRPQFHTLYLQNSLKSGEKYDRIEQALQQLEHEVQLEWVDRYTLTGLAGGPDRPHNGCVLDAAPLSVPHVTRLPATNATTDSNPTRSLWVALDGLHDPRNLGAVFRTCEFFGVSGVVMTSDQSAPLSPTASKASSGAMEVLPINNTKNLAYLLANSKHTPDHYRDYFVIGLTLTPESLDLRLLRSALHKASAASSEADTELDSSETTEAALSSVTNARGIVLVVGNEGEGLHPDVVKQCDLTFKIQPGSCTVEGEGSENTAAVELVDSLNVSNAFAVALYELSMLTLGSGQTPQ